MPCARSAAEKQDLLELLAAFSVYFDVYGNFMDAQQRLPESEA